MDDCLKLSNDILHTFELMPLESIGRLVMAAYHYSESGEIADVPDAEFYMFAMMRSRIDRERENGRKRSGINSKNGAKGGRPKKDAQSAQESVESADKVVILPEQQTAVRTQNTAISELYNADVAEVIRYYEEHVQPDANPRCLEELARFAKKLGKEVCKELINDALDAGKRNWSYMRVVMKDKAQKGVRTVADLDKDRESYRRAKPQKPSQVIPANGGQPTGKAIQESQSWMDSFLDDS